MVKSRRGVSRVRADEAELNLLVVEEKEMGQESIGRYQWSLRRWRVHGEGEEESFFPRHQHMGFEAEERQPLRVEKVGMGWA